MKLGVFRRKRTAFRIALALLLSLLFQHAAIAAYACPLDEVPTSADASMADCNGMEKMDSPLLCEKHCNPDNSTTSDPRVAQVAPVILPPVRFELAKTLHSVAALQLHEDVPALRSGPPPRLRFCSLLI